MCLANANWSGRNYRRHLMEGIRQRLERARLWSQIRFLYSALFEAAELSA